MARGPQFTYSVQEKSSRYDKVLELRGMNYSTAHIARTVGLSSRQVQRYLKAAGVGRNQTPKTSQETLEKARGFLRDGTGYTEAARSVGVSRYTLSKYLPGYAMSGQRRGQLSYSLWKFNQSMEKRDMEKLEL